METAKIQLPSRDFLLILGISLLCFGVCTTGASSIKHLKGSQACCDKEIKLAPYGGPGGDPYSFHSIKEITVYYSTESLEGITLRDEDGNEATLGNTYGRPTKNNTIYLDLPDEYLIGIRGTIGTQDTHTVVKSIGFTTNHQEYDVHGTGAAIPFSTTLEANGKITGFHGRAHGLLDAIGLYVKSVCLDSAKIPKVKSY